jgi:chromosome partitioning protein
MIITVAHTKGGVGKSTLAFHLAVIRGGKTWLIDADRQRTTKTAMLARSQAGRLPLVACDHLPDGKTLHTQLIQHIPDFDDVVIDAGGRDSSALRAALVLSDLVLVPFAPRSLDVWALADISELIREARTNNSALRAVAVLSLAESSGKDNTEAAAALVDYPELVYLDAPIVRRKAFSNAMGLGLVVSELTPKDQKAIEEIKHLFDIIFIS